MSKLDNVKLVISSESGNCFGCVFQKDKCKLTGRCSLPAPECDFNTIYVYETGENDG